MTAYNRRFGKAPRHDFDVHRPLETDDDLTAFFTWREPRRVSKSLTVQYDKVLYLIEDNELSRRAIGKYIEVWHYPDGRKELRLNEVVLPYYNVYSEWTCMNGLVKKIQQWISPNRSKVYIISSSTHSGFNAA